MLTPADIIGTKRDGFELTREQIQVVVDSASGHGPMGDEQLAAWLMAVVLRGMSFKETAWLTDSMAKSGQRIDLSGLPKPWVDKHSTGGVGDKTTLVLVPLCAAIGLTTVKLSGAGLGKTGGTLDKLSAVPGFSTQLSIEEMKAQAAKIGMALGGQSSDLAPADGKLYALRDVTGTVKSIPLIASSILSKKIAGGTEIISLDVKCGSGAFMSSYEEAAELAKVMTEIGKELNLKVFTEITDMDQPLGRMAGNLCEVQEAIRVLMNQEEGRFKTLCVELAASSLIHSGLESDHEIALQKVKEALSSGAALEKCRQWWAAQGAIIEPETILDHPLAPIRLGINAEKSGYVKQVNAEIVGLTVVQLGGGRKIKGEQIDLKVGIETHIEIGDQINEGDLLFTIFANTVESANEAAENLKRAIHLDELPVIRRELFLEGA